MVTRAMAVVMLAGVTLAGCGGAQQSSPHSPDVAQPAGPALAPASAGEQPPPAGEQPQAAADPPALARQLTVAETAIRDRATPPEQAAAAGRAAQVAYRALLDRPEWDAAVLVGVPEPLHDTVRHNTAAGREFRAMATRLPATVPAWRIVEPLAGPQLREHYAEAQQRFGVPWPVLAAVHTSASSCCRPAMSCPGTCRWRSGWPGSRGDRLLR